MASDRSQQDPTLVAQGSPTLALATITRWWTRRWVRISIAAVAALLLAGTALQKLWIDPQLTALKYRVTLVGRENGPTFFVDRDAGVVSVRGAQFGPTQFVLADGRVYLPATTLDPAADSEEWISFPAGDVLAHPQVFSVRNIIESFEIGVKECRVPEARTDDVVKATLAQTFEPGADERRYNLCGDGVGGGRLADGAAVTVGSERIRPSEVFRPETTAITAIEDIGARASELTARAIEAFRTIDSNGD